MVDGETSDIAHDKMRKKFEQLTLRVEEHVEDYIDLAYALAMRLGQHGMEVNDEVKNRRILFDY